MQKGLRDYIDPLEHFIESMQSRNEDWRGLQ